MNEAASVRPVEATSVADRVTSEIRRAIIAGRLRPGQEFSLRRIAAQLGVSFIPVREALRSLETEGLLVTRRGRSATVAPLVAEELHNICQLRRRIEPELAEWACRLLTDAALDTLDAEIEHSRGAGTQPDERYEAHLTLLWRLLGPAASEWDLRMLRILWHATERYLWARCDVLDRADPDGFFAAQYKLVAGYRGGRPESARAAVLAHVDWIEDVAGRGLDPEHWPDSFR